MRMAAKTTYFIRCYTFVTKWECSKNYTFYRISWNWDLVDKVSNAAKTTRFIGYHEGDLVEKVRNAAKTTCLIGYYGAGTWETKVRYAAKTTRFIGYHVAKTTC